jgi:hypothetical protein
MTTIQESAPTIGLADLRDEPREVHQVLSALGRLLGAAVIDPPRNLTSFIEGHLGARINATSAVSASLVGVDAPLVHVAVARLLETVPDAETTDDTAQGSPGFELVAVDVDEHVLAPDDLAAFLPAGTAWAFDVVLVLTWAAGRQHIKLHVRESDVATARGELADFLRVARTSDNFYRGRTLRVHADDHGLTFTPIPPSRAKRAELIHAPEVWREIDTNIGGLIRNREILAAAGLGTSRGLLVVGQPGVGKTELCRVIAAELPAETTVLLVDATTTPRGLGRLFEALPALEPVAIFLDDVDLAAGNRRSGTGGTFLHELLTNLDGFEPTNSVITIATSNVTDTIDPALLRPGRFDTVIEVSPPQAGARAQILRRYLSGLADVDIDRVVALTAGATGADLREIVRRSVLECGRNVDADSLADIASSGRWRPAPLAGQYL